MSLLRPVTVAIAAAIVASLLFASPVAAAPKIRIIGTDDGRLKISWSAGSAPFEVRTSSSQDLAKDVRTYRTSKRSITVAPAKNAGFGSGNYTFVNVYAAGRALAGYPFPHAQVSPATPDPDAARVTVATFNVRTAESDEPGHPWKKRLPLIARQLDASTAGVIAVQEAGANLGKTVNGPYDYDIDWQFDQLEAAVADKYELVYADEYSLESNGGKEGTRILYDSSRYTVADSGFFAPSAINKTMRWVPWALLTEITTGKQFYFVAVHLENGKDAGKSRKLYTLRMKQIGSVIAHAKQFAASGLQVIIAGDLNSNIYSLPKNGVHQRLIAAGFYDAFAALTSKNEFYDTFNFFGKPIRGASRTDYILSLGPQLGSYSYEHVLSTGKKVASDHDLQVATVPF